MSTLSKALFGRFFAGQPQFLQPHHRATHAWVLGQPDTGKSRAIASGVMQDILAGRGVAVIDDHGDLFELLLMSLAAHPQVWPRLAIMDTTDPTYTVKFNPLQAVAGFPTERLALFLTDIIVNIWRIEASSAPRMVWLLTNTFLALSELNLSLLHLPRFLLDHAFRESLLPRLSHTGARDYFAYEFPSSEGGVHQWVTPVMNKLGALVFDRDLRLMFHGRPTIDFRQLIDRQLILLVNIPKGLIGEGASSLLGALIVAHLQKASLSRAETKHRPPFYLYLDEFQNYTSSSNIAGILSESRKYTLSMTLAHQYLDQLPPEVRSAVRNTAGTIRAHRVGYQDAYELVKDIFPSPDFMTTTKTEAKLSRIGYLPMITTREYQEPLGWEGLALELTKLPNRHFWVRQRGNFQPALMRTLDMPDPVETPELLEARQKMITEAGQRYGKLKRDIRQALEKNQTLDRHHGNGKRSGEESTIPLWGE